MATFRLAPDAIPAHTTLVGTVTIVGFGVAWSAAADLNCQVLIFGGAG